MKLFTTVIAATLFLAKATSETKVTASITGNVDQDKVAIDAIEDNLASSNVSAEIVWLLFMFMCSFNPFPYP